MVTLHSPAFAAALDAVSALLGPADAASGSDYEWTRGGAALRLRACIDDPDALLTADRADGSWRTWRAFDEGINDGTARAACERLRWEVPS